MFNLQGSEIIIVLLLALVVLGPEKLPDAMRKMGQFYAELKKLSSGFQSEFRAAVDEPLREIRDTANVLRDSADFTKLQQGERKEKSKSAEMPEAADTDAVRTDTVPMSDTPLAESTERAPELSEDSKPAPFSGVSSAAPRSAPSAVPAPPPPFTAMSAPVDPDAPDAPADEPAAEAEAVDATDTDVADVADAPDDVESVESADGSTAVVQPSDVDDHTGRAR